MRHSRYREELTLATGAARGAMRRKTLFYAAANDSMVSTISLQYCRRRDDFRMNKLIYRGFNEKRILSENIQKSVEALANEATRRIAFYKSSAHDSHCPV
jgi:hypothetical protein